MANRIVRIYEGENDESTVIGFSRSARAATEDPRLMAFMNENNYVMQETESFPAGSWSSRHVEVRPPLTGEAVQAFGKLCLEIVDGNRNFVAVYDNRDSLPTEQNFGELVALG